MHFPELARRTEYKKKRDGTYYADYHEYHAEISEDCQHRCVYCDAHLKEVGGEGMHLDHFKPQKHFPELENNPENLVLACSRCNYLKSDWWPEKNGNSNGGQHGFIDPFDKDKSSYFEVDSKGEILAKKAPSGYVIDLLSLNRPSRVNIRRRRILSHRAKLIMDGIIQQLADLPKQPQDVIQQRIPVLTAALRDVRTLIFS